MKRQQPIVFIGIDFFKKYISECLESFIMVQSKEYRTFLYNLIFGNSTIYIDIDRETLVNIIEQPNNIVSQHLLNLSRINVIRHLNSDIRKFIDSEIIKGKSLMPDYILVDINDLEANKWNKELGIIVLSSDFLKIPDHYHSVQLIDFIANKDTNFSDYLKRLPKAKSIIIEDPYFYSESSRFLETFFSELLCTEFVLPKIEILIIIQGTKYIHDDKAKELHFDGVKRLHEVRDNLEVKFEGRLRINIQLNDKYKMHDRHIMSNSYWITSGHSFKQKYNTNTTWIIKPLAKYFPKFRDRIHFATLFIKDQLIPIKHSLLDI